MTPLESSEVTLQVVVSPTIIILTALEVSFILLENIYSTSVTHDNRHLRLSYFYSRVHCWLLTSQTFFSLLLFFIYLCCVFLISSLIFQFKLHFSSLKKNITLRVKKMNSFYDTCFSTDWPMLQSLLGH
jgi:hypothetical protein